MAEPVQKIDIPSEPKELKEPKEKEVDVKELTKVIKNINQLVDKFFSGKNYYIHPDQLEMSEADEDKFEKIFRPLDDILEKYPELAITEFEKKVNHPIFKFYLISNGCYSLFDSNPEKAIKIFRKNLDKYLPEVAKMEKKPEQEAKKSQYHNFIRSMSYSPENFKGIISKIDFSQFTPDQTEMIITRLFEKNMIEIAENMDSINLPKEKLFELVSKTFLRDPKPIFDNIEKFKFSQKQIEELVDGMLGWGFENKAQPLFDNIDKLNLPQGIHDRIVQDLKHGNVEMILENWNKISPSQAAINEVRIYLYDRKPDLLLKHLDKFDMTKERLINKKILDRSKWLFENMNKFELTDDQKREIIAYMINRFPEVIVTKLDEFKLEKPDLDKIANRLSMYRQDKLLENLDKLGITKDEAIDMIIQRSPRWVIENINELKLTAEQKTKVVDIALKTQYASEYLIKNYDKFEFTQPQLNLLIQLTAGRNPAILFEYAKKMKLTDETIINSIIKENAIWLLRNMPIIEGKLDEKELEDELDKKDEIEKIKGKHQFTQDEKHKLTSQILLGDYSYEVSLELIEKYIELFENIGQYELNDQEKKQIMKYLIEKNIDEMFDLYPKFGITKKEFTLCVLAKNPVIIIDNLSQFGITEEQMPMLIHELTVFHPENLIKNIDKVKLENKQESYLVNELIDKNPGLLFENLDKVNRSKGQFIMKAAHSYMATKWMINNFNEHIKDDPDFNDFKAKFIKASIRHCPDRFVTIIDNFTLTDDQQELLVEKLLDKKKYGLILQYLDKIGYPKDEFKKLVIESDPVWLARAQDKINLTDDDMEKMIKAAAAKPNVIQGLYIHTLFLENLSDENKQELIDLTIQQSPEPVFIDYLNNDIELSKSQYNNFIFQISSKLTAKALKRLDDLELSDLQKKYLIEMGIEKAPNELLKVMGKLPLTKEHKTALTQALLKYSQNYELIYKHLDNLELSEKDFIDMVIPVNPRWMLWSMDQEKLPLTDEQKDELFNHAAVQTSYALFTDFIKHFEITPKRKKLLAEQLISKTNLRVLFENPDKLNMSKVEVAKLALEKGQFGFLLTNSSLYTEEEFQQFAPEYYYHQGLDSLKDLALIDKSDKKHIPWYDSLQKLKKVQAFADKKAYCPWVVALTPLINEAEKREDIDLSLKNKKDGQLFLSFVKDFGPFNTPELLSTYVALKKTKKLEDVPPNVKNYLIEIIGPKKIEKLPNNAAILNEIKLFRTKLMTQLLKDKMPKKIDSALGIDIFKGMLGTTRWGRSDNYEDLFYTWQNTIEKNPQATKLPNGYTEKAVKIEADILRPAFSEQELKQQERKILDREKLIEAFNYFKNAIKQGVEIDDIGSFWKEEKQKLIDSIDIKIKANKDRLETLPEKARPGIEKNIQRLTEAKQTLENSILSPGADENELIELMNKLSQIKEAWPVLHTLSAFHLNQISAQGWKEILEKISQAEDTLTKQDIDRVGDLMVFNIREHYLHSDQIPEHTYHQPFSKNLVKALGSLWQTSQDSEKHILLSAQKKLENIQIGERKSIVKTEVNFVPQKGLLRIFAGDIGDACYTSQHFELANGEYEGITAIVFVTNRNKPQQNIEGSVLFIETTTPDGKKVLNIRANNPRENLLTKAGQDALIKEILDYAIETAKKRKIDIVTVPLDKSTNSSSNRDKVAEYYQNHFSLNPRIKLTYEPETSFNGYANWDADGNHAVVIIWEKE